MAAELLQDAATPQWQAVICDWKEGCQEANQCKHLGLVWFLPGQRCLAKAGASHRRQKKSNAWEGAACQA
ncbi:hypothetical protein EJB05_30497, partial [Eragrostis curvula]